MNIAIIDDVQQDLDALAEAAREHYDQKQISIQLHTFSSPEDFWNSYSPGSYDLIFLDIYIKQANGMDLAAQLHTDAGVLRRYLTFQKFEELIHDLPCFLSCYRGCLVNMDRIYKTLEEGFLLDNQETVQIRKRGANAIKKEYLNYLFS